MKMYTGRQPYGQISRRMDTMGTGDWGNKLRRLPRKTNKRREEMPSITKTQFCNRMLVATILFFAIGQYLFGCTSNTAQLRAWSEVERTTTIQQGLTDREMIRGAKRQGDGEGASKITISPAPEQLPTITTTTVTPAQVHYTDEMGEIDGEDGKTVTEIRVDTTALAIQQLGKVALALAERTGGPVLPKIKDEGKPTRIVYQRHPMPQSNAPEVIKNVGSALKESGLVTGIVSGFLGWIAGNTIQEVAKVPSNTGDYVQLQDSNNPVTTTTTTAE